LRPLTVLYIHASASFGGASKSLCELLQAMPAGSVRPIVVCPSGSAADRFRLAGAQLSIARGVSKWDHTRYGFYRGVRWLLLFRELLFAVPAWLALTRLRRQISHVDLIHANDITVLLAAATAARSFHAPLVVHVRSLQNDNPRLWRTRLQNWLLRRTNAHVVAIDETVRRTLPSSMPISVVHNGLRVRRDNATPDRLTSGPRPFRVAIVGVLLRLKGVFEFVEAARLCRDRGIQAEFWIVGENVRELGGMRGKLLSLLGFAEDVRAKLSAEIRAHGLQEVVKLLGFVDDVQSIYRQIDVLCFPSHLDAAGRPVFEAAWFGVPSIVAVKDPLPDTVVDGQSGLCVPDSDPQTLAAAILRLHADPAERDRLGAGARRLAETHFDQERNALRMLEIYRSKARDYAAGGGLGHTGKSKTPRDIQTKQR
jgi:glycosyltransferase involved in cell wall biosynthesis